MVHHIESEIGPLGNPQRESGIPLGGISWLGRIILDLENETHEREVIFNPVNGSVMRDFTEAKHSEGEEDGPWYLHLFAPFRGDTDE